MNKKNFKINSRVREFMKQKGLDEMQMSRDLRKHASSIYRITTDVSVPTRSTLMLIAEIYKVDINYFYGDSPLPAADSVNEDEIFWRKKYEDLFNLFNKIAGNPAKSNAFEFAGVK